MTIKQLAARIGVDPKRLDFELSVKCGKCKKMGGNELPCTDADKVCEITVVVAIQE